MHSLHVWANEAALEHQNCTPGHPESPARWRVLNEALQAVSWPVVWHEPELAAVAQVERVHASGYVAALVRHTPVHGCAPLDEDTGLRPGSLQAALLGSGAAIAAVEKAVSGEVSRAFSLMRPPGHHAEPAQSMGFCLIHHVAVAVAHARALGVERVAVVDFDVHHGNGTETMLAGREGVRFCSSFQHPFYPYRGVPPKADNCVSLPLASGSDGAAFRDVWAPVLTGLAEWRPQLVLVSAGFDAHVRDPLANLMLEADDFAWMGARLAELDAPVVSVLEGGYNLEALKESALAYLEAQL